MRTKKAAKNLVFNIVQQFVGIITSFIVPPLIVSQFGSVINGLVATLKQIMRYVQLTGSGIASVSTYSLYEPLAKKDGKKISSIYNAAGKTFTRAGHYFSIIIFICALIYPFFAKGVPSKTVFLLVIVMAISGASEFYVIGKYQSLLNADQRNYTFAFTQTIGNLLYILVTITLIKFNFGIIAVQLGASVIYVFRILFLTYYVRKHYPYLDKTVAPDFSALKQRNDAIVHEIAALVVNGSSVVLLSLLIDLKTASVYSVYLLVFSGLNMICSIFSSAIYASFGDIIAKGEKKALAKSFDIYELLFTTMIFIIYTACFLLIDPFIGVYTRAMIDTQYLLPSLGALFVIQGLFNNIKVPARTLIPASGHFDKTRNRALLEMIINLIAQITLIPIFGIYGAVLGNIASACYRAFDAIIYSNKHILKNTNLRMLKRASVSVITFGALVIYLPKVLTVSATNYLTWIILALKICLIIIPIYLGVNYIFNRESFKDIKHSFKYLISRR